MVGVQLFANTFSPYTFIDYDIPLGDGKQFTILTGDVLGDSILEVLALDRVDNYQTHLQIFTLKEDGWSKQIDAMINPFVFVVDIANIGGKERLVFFARRSLNYFDTETNSEKHLIDVNFHFQPDTTIAIPHKDIAQDLNGDGLSDFILPLVQGFWLHTQLANGEFAQGIFIGPPEPFREQNTFDDPRPYGVVGIKALTTPWYLSRVHNFDVNLDGRKDIVFWNEDHFDVYLQAENGLFNNDPKSFNTDVPFDTDGVYSVVFGYTESNLFSLITGLK